MGQAGRTRRRLQEEAIKLVTARGFDNVTVAEIATAAGVSHMTFFRHYPTKVSVLLDDPYDPVIGDMVAATDPALPPITRIRTGLLEAWRHVDEPDDEVTRARLRILTCSDELLAAAWANTRETERVITNALVTTGVPTLEARVAAGAVLGAMMAALIDWGEREDTGPLGDRIRLALELLGGSDD